MAMGIIYWLVLYFMNWKTLYTHVIVTAIAHIHFRQIFSMIIL